MFAHFVRFEYSLYTLVSFLNTFFGGVVFVKTDIKDAEKTEKNAFPPTNIGQLSQLGPF